MPNDDGLLSRFGSAVARLWRGGGHGARPQASASLATGLTLDEALSRLGAFGPADSGVSVTVDNAQGLAAVAACERVVGDDIAHLPLVLYRRDRNRVVPDRDNPLYRLLHDRPNEWQTSFEWRRLKQRDLFYRGVAYSLIVRGPRREPIELIRLHPDRMKAVQDPSTLAVTFEFSRPDGRRVVLSRRDVLVVRGTTDDGITPLSPIALHRNTIGTGLAMRKHGGSFFANGAKPLGVVTIEPGHDMTEPGRAAFRADFDEMHAGNERAHRVAIMPPGLKYEPVTISNEDAQWLEAQGMNRSEICGLFGVPPHKIGDLSRATFSNIEHQALEYVTGSLAPRLVNWEQAIARDLLDGAASRFVRFNVDALLRGDAKSRNEALQIQRRNGVISANEWRQLVDLNPRTDAGGDEYIVERNMGPQGQQ